MKVASLSNIDDRGAKVPKTMIFRYFALSMFLYRLTAHDCITLCLSQLKPAIPEETTIHTHTVYNYIHAVVPRFTMMYIGYSYHIVRKPISSNEFWQARWVITGNTLLIICHLRIRSILSCEFQGLVPARMCPEPATPSISSYTVIL